MDEEVLPTVQEPSEARQKPGKVKNHPQKGESSITQSRGAQKIKEKYFPTEEGWSHNPLGPPPPRARGGSDPDFLILRFQLPGV